jgi:hypothetical protein
VINIDDETPGFIVTPLAGLTTTEAGDVATFTVVLTAPPQQIVTVDVSSTSPKEAKVFPPRWLSPRSTSARRRR